MPSGMPQSVGRVALRRGAGRRPSACAIASRAHTVMKALSARLDRGDSIEAGAGQFARGDFAPPQTLARFGDGQLVQASAGHSISDRHSMIFGTLKKKPSRAGALASIASAAGGLVTTSSRIGVPASPTWAVGSTASVSSSLSLST